MNPSNEKVQKLFYWLIQFLKKFFFYQNVLHIAAQKPNSELIKSLLSAFGIGEQKSNWDFMTLDFLSLEKDVENIDSAPPIIDPVDINSKDYKISIFFSNGISIKIYFNNTALIYAIEQGFVPVVDILLNAEGVDVNSQNNHYKKKFFNKVFFYKIFF